MILFIFGCAGSLLLCGLFSSCSERQLYSSCSARASHCSGFSCCRAETLRCAGLSSCGSQALERRPNSSSAGGSVALRHVGSSLTRDQTHVSCSDRYMLYH